MFPFWLILGIVTILIGIFNRQMSRRLGLKPMSEVLTTPNLRHSSRLIERLAQWLVITLGAGFAVQGLGGTLPAHLSDRISLSLLGLSALLLVIMIGIAVVNWKAR